MSESPNSIQAHAGSLPNKERRCEVHGTYSAKHVWGNFWASCPTCDEEREERERLRKEAEIRAQAKAILEFNLHNSGLIGWCKSASFESFVASTPEQEAVAKVCREFVETLDPEGGNGLWLIGPPGVGKTHLASACVNHLIKARGMAACIFGVHEIMAELRKRWGVRGGRDWTSSESFATTDEFISHLGEIPLLALDEVGVTAGSDHELQQLFAIVDLRSRLCRPTVLLSNLDPRELKVAVGGRVFDRLRQNAKLLVCNWPSQRGKVVGQ